MRAGGSPTTRITSRQNPLVARFRDAARGGPAASLLLEGPHLVAEALDAGIALEALVVSDTALDRPEVAVLTRRVPSVVTATPAVLGAMTPARSASGVVALARRPTVSPADAVAGIDPLVVIAVDVQDPGNLGAILRAAEAGGVSGALTTRAGADPFGWKALRGSMGSAFRLPVGRVEDGATAVRLARAHGLRIVAAVNAGGTSLWEASLAGPLALVLGGEGGGLPPDVAALADEAITIPMAPPVESLNVAVAAALLVYEARRPRAEAGEARSARR